MWLRGRIKDGAIQIKRPVNFKGGVEAAFAEPWANVWYVDGVSGDDGNSGKDPDRAKILISAAEAAAANNDIIRLKTGDHIMPAKVNWDLYDARLIGSSPIPFQPRVDVWMLEETTFDPMFEVSGRGNIFANITFRHGGHAGSQVGYATDLTCMKISGRYNMFDNVYFYTPLYAQQDVAATYKGVQITGHNNHFRGCKFGSDGMNRDQANWNVSIEGGIGNIFEDCFFQMGADGVAPFFVQIYSTPRDMKATLFKNCTFYVHSANFGTTISYAIDGGYQANTAAVILDNCNFVNVGQISDTDKDVWIWKAVKGNDNIYDASTNSVKISQIALRNQGV